MEALAGSEHLRNLTSLKLGGNDIGDQGAAALRDSAQSGPLRSLQDLNLEDNPDIQPNTLASINTVLEPRRVTAVQQG